MKAIKYFTADYCQPCKTFGPIMDELQFEGINIQKIDIEQQQNMAIEYNVKSIPTCVVVDGSGKELASCTGMKPKEYILEMYNNA